MYTFSKNIFKRLPEQLVLFPHERSLLVKRG